MDPDEDDYPFNRGLLALRANDAIAAAGYFREATGREPDNPEDRALLILALEKAGKKSEADEQRGSAEEAFGPKGLPAIHWDAKDPVVAAKLDRVKTELDTTQLQLQLKSQDTGSSAAGTGAPGPDSAAGWIRRGRQNLAAGQIENADRAFRAALASEPGNSAAHRGLAEVDRRQGKLDDTVKELLASLQSRDSAVVRTTLARVYLEQKKPELARAELEKALKLAPNYTEAKQLLEHLRKSKPGAGIPNGGVQ
jgi:tetratricopeptide (TPR) repeat protein